eukprot:2919441-Amphidinium_carterae.1
MHDQTRSKHEEEHRRMKQLLSTSSLPLFLILPPQNGRIGKTLEAAFYHCSGGCMRSQEHVVCHFSDAAVRPSRETDAVQLLRQAR